MYFFSDCLDQFRSSLGYDETEITFVGVDQVHSERKVVSRSAHDAEEHVIAWSIAPFVAVITHRRHDTGGEIQAIPAVFVDARGNRLSMTEDQVEAVLDGVHVPDGE